MLSYTASLTHVINGDYVDWMSQVAIDDQCTVTTNTLPRHTKER